jgi:hypothetical protein
MCRTLVAIGALLLLAFSCHAQEGDAPPAVPVPPATITFESSVGDVRFPHDVHMKFGCAACHHQIRASELVTPHPQYLESAMINCEICHNAGEAARNPYYKCADCHHSVPENIADETLSSKVVIHKSCWKCHQSGTGVAASGGCGDCHVTGAQ